jgi:uncharacterized cofD-like protein
MIKEPKIVCLGGGIGTVHLLRGLRKYTHNITVVVSMADDGASAGRLRRLYSIPPPGDLINCLAALSNAEPLLSQLLTYRFKGKRWGKDDSLGGHKLGSLILVAMTEIYGDFNKALEQMQRIFQSNGVIFPATTENVSIWAKTIEGKTIKGEENIDLGKYSGKREIEHVFLDPVDATAPKNVIKAMTEADLIIAGPGDLYTTILPILLVSNINQSLKKFTKKAMYIVNITNKPFETPNYKASNFLDAIIKHIGNLPFNYVLVNTNFQPQIPAKFHYRYVPVDTKTLKSYNTHTIKADLVEEKFPLYHNPDKLARTIFKIL